MIIKLTSILCSPFFFRDIGLVFSIFEINMTEIYIGMFDFSTLRATSASFFYYLHRLRFLYPVILFRSLIIFEIFGFYGYLSPCSPLCSSCLNGPIKKGPTKPLIFEIRYR